MKIIWTKTSELTLNEIIDYIENKFGSLISYNYYFDVLVTVNDIEINPELFPIYQHKTETRKAVINKKTILYYQIKEENIYLLAFYDVRKGTHKL
jgi:hypothetical protein